MVYVQNSEGKPLMPTERHGWVRRALRDGRAKVVRLCPFTVRLTYACQNGVQDVTLGIDAGSRHIGLSATTAKKELYSGQYDLRTDISELLADRRALRSVRRRRKLRYRPARFSNRLGMAGKLPPSVRARVDGHIRAVAHINKIVPIHRIVIEVAKFDVHRLKNPEISGNGYQGGEQAGFWNVREYVMTRDKYTCQNCFGKTGDRRLHVHHIESRRTGGDAPNNLITLCATCHSALHAGNTVLKVRRGTALRDEAVMNIMHKSVYARLAEAYDNVGTTYGYVTRMTRIRHNVEKTHAADAYCITGNVSARRSPWFNRNRFVRRHNRKLHKLAIVAGGVRRANQAARVVKGIQLFDVVRYNGIRCFVTGRRAVGNMMLRDFDMNVVNKNARWNKLTLLAHSGTCLTETACMQCVTNNKEDTVCESPKPQSR